jgi:peptide deformylase
MLKIITQPNPILRQKAEAVPPEIIISPAHQALIAEMVKTMKANEGVGLAAPQVSRSLQLVVIDRFYADGQDGILVVHNPIFLKKSLLKENGEEGCLSVPGYFGIVRRHRSVVVQYLDEKGQSQIIKAHKYLARVLQHEIDHLQGILYTDLAKKLYQTNHE